MRNKSNALSPSQAGIARAQKKWLTQLPKEGKFTYDELGNFSKSAFDKAVRYDLVEKVGGRGTKVWVTNPNLVRYYNRYDAYTDQCGKADLLPCGGSAFVNTGDGIKCRVCETVYSKEEIKQHA